MDALTQKNGIGYYVKDLDNQVLFGSEAEKIGTQYDGFLMNMIREMRSNSTNKSTVEIPIMNQKTGKVKQILVLTQNSATFATYFILINICVPIICLIGYALFFSRSLSEDMKKPIDELMIAVEKMKSRDLDFSIQNHLDNEIGDLASAFEAMRVNLKDSLMREWQIEQDRREMVVAITHDLRTPLTIIQGHVEGLKEGFKKDSKKLDAYLEIIEENVLRAKRLIDEMNGLAEIDCEGFELSLGNEDMHVFINSTVAELQVLARTTNISIELDIVDHRKENKLIAFDRFRLSQVLNNLIGNGIRFTPEEGRIQVKVEILEKRVDFKISDSGQGFSEKDLHNIFKKFYKGDASRSIEKGHSGLGLYITKSIIEKHGGSIQGSNVMGCGASLDFFIVY